MQEEEQEDMDSQCHARLKTVVETTEEGCSDTCSLPADTCRAAANTHTFPAAPVTLRPPQFCLRMTEISIYNMERVQLITGM